MKQDEIIRMARDAGIVSNAYDAGFMDIFTKKLERFAALVAAHEREKQAEQEIIPSWEEYCECEGIPCEPVKPVDLTDDEIYEVLKRYTKTERYKDDFGSYRAVIAKFKEKNK